MKRRRILGLVGAVSLATALLGSGCIVVPGPAAPVGSYYVSHVHVHGPDCGHYRAWHEGMWVYYFDGRWEYYNPGYHRWVYYHDSHVPTVLRGHVSYAKSYRPYAVPGYSRGSGDPYATKAPPGHGYGRDTGPGYGKGPGYDDRPGATKAPPPRDPYGDPGASKAPPYRDSPSYGGSGASKAPPRDDDGYGKSPPARDPGPSYGGGGSTHKDGSGSRGSSGPSYGGSGASKAPPPPSSGSWPSKSKGSSGPSTGGVPSKGSGATKAPPPAAKGKGK